MELSKEMVAENEAVIRQANGLYGHGETYYAKTNRIKALQQFCTPYKRILSVGCGPYEPIILKASYACDVSFLAFSFLVKQGWSGQFKVCSCLALPYKDKEFDCAVLTEVIEHLASLEDARKAVQEVNRIAENWIITTPLASRWGFRDSWNIEPTHKLFFSKEAIPDLMQDIDYYFKIVQDGQVKHAVLTSRKL